MTKQVIENALLSVEAVSKNFKDKQALKNVTLQIKSDEIYGLVGESGSGKSTLGNIIVGLIKPSEGRVLINDLEITQETVTDHTFYHALGSKVQIVFQNPQSSLNPRKKILNILDEALVIQGKIKDQSDRKKRIVESIERVGLSEADLNKYPRAFSGGQSQRIALARALIVEPQLIVLDEAVSALDVSVQAQILKLLKDIKEEFKISYLFISHDLRVVKETCDRVGVLYQGDLVEEGQTKDIYANPQEAYTKSLIHSIPEIHFW